MLLVYITHTIATESTLVVDGIGLGMGPKRLASYVSSSDLWGKNAFISLAINTVVTSGLMKQTRSGCQKLCM